MAEIKFAVLIDADNISEKYINVILDEVSKEGVATYKRIYGDWTKPNLAQWKKTLLDNSIIPVQQYNYTTGKSSTDSALIIDAMDILYTGRVDGFCLISSDSDFTRLAARLRESAMVVIGMGEQKTPKPFIAACNQFKYLDKLLENVQKSKNKQESDDRHANAQRPVQMADYPDEESSTDINTIAKAIEQIVDDSSDEDGWMLCSVLGDILLKRFPDFDVRNFGFSKITLLLKKLGLYELRYDELRNGARQYSFRRKQQEQPEKPEKPVVQRRRYSRKKVDAQ